MEWSNDFRKFDEQFARLLTWRELVTNNNKIAFGIDKCLKQYFSRKKNKLNTMKALLYKGKKKHLKDSVTIWVYMKG